ncbi:Sentrin-specific protease 7 [Varanus komodoensis]|nr:Sentrin-specific protease 7 [Varanus komodoensis]
MSIKLLPLKQRICILAIFLDPVLILMHAYLLQYQRRPNDQKPSRDAESDNALVTLRRCDVMLEDCSIKNKEGNRPEKERKGSKNLSPGLREASFQNSESRKRRGDVFSNQWNPYSPQKSPLANKEQKTEPVQSPGCIGSNRIQQSDLHNPQQENIPQTLKSDCSGTFISINQDTGENDANSTPKRKQHSITNKAEQISQLVSSARKQKVHIILRLKEPLNRSKRNKETADSTEPIVLSSDDEEGGGSESKDAHSYFQTEKDQKPKEEEREQESVLSLSEELLLDKTESRAQQVSPESLTLHSSTDCSTFSKQKELALEIKSEKVYIGKYKGTATGCIKFTTRYIKIPFEVTADKKIELSVDSMHLQRYGLWTNNDSTTSGSNVTIFLWLSSDYAEQIENQMETSVLNSQARSKTFIFVKLSQPLTEEEQNLLNKIMVEVSKKNTSPNLTDSLPWDQAVKDISYEDSAFMDDCYESFQQQLQKDSASVLTDPVAQVIRRCGLKCQQHANTQLYLTFSSDPAFVSLLENPRGSWSGIEVEINNKTGELEVADLCYGVSSKVIVRTNGPDTDKAVQNQRQRQEEGEVKKDNKQESKSDLTQLNYTLLQRQNSGRYSFSISATQRNEWKELRENKGLIQNLIVYPPPPAKGGLGVTREDLECLEYGEFLNDVIIDFYLKYLLLEKAPRELADRSHIFSSFFYKCLTRSEKNSEENPNLSSHWYIAVICFPWLEEVVYEDGPQPCSLQSCFQQLTYQPPKNSNTSSEDSVLVFNDTWSDKEELDINCNLQLQDNVQPATVSLDLDSKPSKSSSSSSKMKKVCKRYLEAEWEAKRKTPREFSKSTVLDFCPRVPKQDNSSDCGVYLLQYVETFFQNPIVNFELPMHLERWFPRQVVRSKREEIRDLILQLHLQQQSGSKS